MPDIENYDTQKDWMKACVPVVMDEGKEQDEAVAQCLNMWREAHDENKIIRFTPQRVRPYKTTEGEWRLEVLGAPFGGHVGGKDYQGEFFSPRTDFMVDVGDERPVLYYHGDMPSGTKQPKPQVIGRAKVARKDEKGLWFEVILDKSKKLAQRIWDAAVKGIVKASSGAVNYLVRRAQDGELLSWPIGELTLVDQGQGRIAANQLATVSLKTVYAEAELELPENFVQEPERSETELVQEEEAEAEPKKTDNNREELITGIVTVIGLMGGNQND